MKTTLIILYLFFGIIGYSQVATKVIEVDLGKPHKKSITIYTDSLSTALDSSKWLSVRSRDLVSIKLINWNPLKHTYKIDTKELSFFNDKKKLDSIIEGIKVLVNNEIPELVLLNDSIKRIIKENENVIKSIDSLNFQVENFYEILKQKSKLVEDDYNVKRKEFLDNSKIQLGKIYSLLNDLQNIEDNSSSYSDTQKNLLETKEKSEKSIESIIQKFYTINLDIYTLPIDIQGKNIDVLEFKLSRFNKETKEEDANFASTPYNIWIKGGLKIDVSAGIFFTSLYDSEYDKRDDPATSGNKIIMLKNSGDYDMAFGSTINTYIRMNSWVVPTLNFGAVITQNQKLQVLLGLGAILGKQERIIFSAGISMGKVDRIADGYQVGSSYNLGDSGTIPTQSQFKFGKFFGITYNLSKVKKISLDKGIEEN
ncbi:hypothetical protein [Flavobacterium geliluteum]|uniref:Uncharacterized protein n=1 Tax=Flavobacterium geliluteum TaxID=2816120 RepID=A0A940X9P1_9FLAO|nr:hypothetical protein [Flavobacterium geliluteum]MBP4138307.1 hypothetical protein [Flavobacterium geliluteum]